jgi:hypothetical protein
MQGGLGFMVEADASLFFLRSKGWSVLAGDPTLDLISVGTAAIALQRKAPLWTSP